MSSSTAPRSACTRTSTTARAASQLPQARPGGLRHRLYAGNDAPRQGGAFARLPRHHRRRDVRPPGGPAVQAVHPARRAHRIDAQGRQTRSGLLPPRRDGAGDKGGDGRRWRTSATDSRRRTKRAGRRVLFWSPCLLFSFLLLFSLSLPGRSARQRQKRGCEVCWPTSWAGTGWTRTRRWKNAYGQSIRAIFAEEGEAGFREKEAAVLAELCRLPRHIIATGGGVVLRASNGSSCVPRRGSVADRRCRRCGGDCRAMPRRPRGGRR